MKDLSKTPNDADSASMIVNVGGMSKKSPKKPNSVDKGEGSNNSGKGCMK
jgi:hypothetical protein